MNPETKALLTTVTPLSRYLAMALFIAMPFVGVYIGYTFALEKVVEVERVVEQVNEVEEIKTEQENVVESYLRLYFVGNEVETSSFVYSSNNDFQLFINNDTINFGDRSSSTNFLRVHSPSLEINPTISDNTGWVGFAINPSARGEISGGSIFKVTESSFDVLERIASVRDFEWLSDGRYRYKQFITCRDGLDEYSKEIIKEQKTIFSISDPRCDQADLASMFPGYTSDWFYDSL